MIPYLSSLFVSHITYHNLIDDFFVSKGGAAVKTNYIFSYGKMNEALDNLNEAVMSGSKAEATNQAKTLVQVCESLTSLFLHPYLLT